MRRLVLVALIASAALALVSGLVLALLFVLEQGDDGSGRAAVLASSSTTSSRSLPATDTDGNMVPDSTEPEEPPAAVPPQDAAPSATAAPASAQAEFVPGEILVVFKPGTPEATATQIFAEAGIHLLEHFEQVDVYHVTVVPGMTVSQTVALLEQDPNVEGASPNYVDELTDHLTEPNDLEYSRQWGLNNRGRNLVGAAGISGNAVGVIDADVDAPQAWEHTADCRGEVVAVLDSGMDIAHPDFGGNFPAGNVWVNPGDPTFNGADNDANGIVDDVGGANFAAYEMHAENVAVDGLFQAGEAIYWDVDSTTTVTGPDILLSGPALAAGSALVDFGNLVKHAENIAVNGRYDGGESVYLDADSSGTVNAGDSLVQGPAQPVATALINFVRISNNNLVDVTGHGTNVASVVGAVGNNGINIAGVCWRVQLLTVKVARPPAPGSISISDRVAAITYVVGLKTRAVNPINVRIINNSSGGMRPGSAPELAAINAAAGAGILFVTASGNDAINVDGPLGPYHPCNYAPPGLAPVDNVICVGASDNRDSFATFSNWGPTSVDLSAPGVDVLMLRRAQGGGGTEYANGTSFAAPHVAGAAAHCWTLFPADTIAQVRARLLNPVDSRPNLNQTRLVAGPTQVVSGIGNDGRLRMCMGDDFGDAPDPFTGPGAYPTLKRNPALGAGPQVGASHEDIGEEWFGNGPPFRAVRNNGDGQPRLHTREVSSEFDANVVAPFDADGPMNLIDNDFHDDGIGIVPPAGGAGVVNFQVCTENHQVVDASGPGGTDAGRYIGGAGPALGVPARVLVNDRAIYVNGFFDWNLDGDFDDVVGGVSEYAFSRRFLPPAPTVGAAGAATCHGFLAQPYAAPAVVPDVIRARFRLDYGEDVQHGLAGLAPGVEVDHAGPPVARYDASATLNRSRGQAQFGEVQDYPPAPVGGIAEPLGQPESRAEAAGGSSPRDYAAPIAAAVAGAVVALAAGGWYVRRRWLR
jgi:hypothetical protein